MVLSLFIIFVLCTFLNQIDFQLSYFGSTAALILTIFFSISLYFGKKMNSKRTKPAFVSFCHVHWLSICLFLLAPSSGVFCISLFCLFLVELILRVQNTKGENAKSNLLILLSIRPPMRKTEIVFFLSVLLVLPTWIAILSQQFYDIGLNFNTLPFILFAFCFSKQLIHVLSPGPEEPTPVTFQSFGVKIK